MSSSSAKYHCPSVAIAPQALPYAGRNLNDDPFVFGTFDGSDVVYRQVNEEARSTYDFPSSQSNVMGLYSSNMLCTRGSMGVDNSCICPGTPNQMPFDVQPPSTTQAVNNLLYYPYAPGNIPALTPAARKLVGERKPLPPAYRKTWNMDAALPKCQ